MVAGGYRAIDSLRLEKGYRAWGSDITADESPFQAGLGFAVKLDKPMPFVGRDAAWIHRERPPATRLACVVLDDPRSIALGSEPVRVDGAIAGRVTSGGFGYTVGRSILYAYLPLEASEVGRAVEVEIFGRWVPGVVAPEPLFDPEGTRVRS
jgi:4-methylaminobutanoate oxidase (formaldehyde-forming)